MPTGTESYPVKTKKEVEEFIGFLRDKDFRVFDDPIKPGKVNIFKKPREDSCLLIESGYIDRGLLELNPLGGKYLLFALHEYVGR